MSWIHEVDMNRLFERALSDPTLQGPYCHALRMHPVEGEGSRITRLIGIAGLILGSFRLIVPVREFDPVPFHDHINSGAAFAARDEDDSRESHQ